MKGIPSESDIKAFYAFAETFLQNEKKRIESFNYKEQNQMVPYDRGDSRNK